ncbi:restriction endonuclease subunit S [Candidatus Sulfuricurvum sp. RIFRC-1]|uniref:restriction endonuclease subunit S n=1 Tax=Candidatus Sulfuricurvum sp. RIFRC-1 TaxID=1249480 RepID=UPI0025BC617B|nr:restriction endonuclease subunit S [Candidatus Sulfuricurvum sp. RIFRC-1]
MSNEKNLLLALGFTSKENSNGIFHKKYADNYTIEIDFVNEKFNYGNLIQAESKTTQNFSQKENWVVLECVDRLIEKGYAPNRITLEKVFPSGHGTSGRLDILVSRNDGTAYMMIECKTWGAEFEKEFKNLNKDGGQLFTYFQQDNNTDILILYASRYNEADKHVEYTNQIVKVEEEYRAAGNVKDFYDRWNKLPKNNGIFEESAKAYGFVSKALTRKDLKALKSEDSSFIFNRFLEILRHNVVSDKPNAFNKIFTLFLCKIIDETRTLDEELHFQWLEGKDTSISFQKRLSDLYTRGMKELLEKEVTDVSDSQFDKEFQQVDDLYRDKFKDILTEIRLKKNNEFAIKEVYDDDSFNENAIVVKEIVELLQNYQIRYNYRQQFLSDFFELLLTTGLKQESGQFFTPVPVARFIIRSIPFVDIAKAKIEKADKTDLLPVIIDYSAGSGHFITESMEEVQNYIDTIDESKLSTVAAKSVAKWKADQFDWAEDYVYAIEKDYRLVKTAKVSCYLHGDGLAKVIHGDGLADFETAKEYKDKLKITDKTYKQDNKAFDIVVSNPPYSVSAFKGMMNSEKSANNFELYGRLTDQSSEIEALFIERTKQLLKDGGIAGVILPSSILSNGGIYSDAREIILKYFDIIGITELGSNTFMATGTNTVVLFLRRRNNADHRNIKESISKLFENKNDITINGVETPLSKYLAHVYEGMHKDEYFSTIENSVEEQEKLLYFIITYPQKVVIVKTGSKNDEKKFLGYEFSTRRGSEGIHPIQRDKTIDECTMLYDPNSYDNEKRASSYIYSAYKGEFKPIDETLKENISYARLVDMLDFERTGFRNTISLNIKKKVVIASKWELEKIGNICSLEYGKSLSEQVRVKGEFPVMGSNGQVGWHNEFIVKAPAIIVGRKGSVGKVVWQEKDCCPIDTTYYVVCKNNAIDFQYLYLVLLALPLESLGQGAGVPGLNRNDVYDIQIPLPPLKIQEQIVKECEDVDNLVILAQNTIEDIKIEIDQKIQEIYQSSYPLQKLKEITSKIGSGATPLGGESAYKQSGITLIRSMNIYDDGFKIKGLAYIDDTQAKRLDNVTVQENDILFNITGASVARCCIVENQYLPARVNQHVSIIRLNESALPQYVHQILIGSHAKNELLFSAGGGTTREAITKTMLEDFKIPLPSLKIQKKIVTEIEALGVKLAEAKSLIESAKAKKEAILKKYL